MDDKHLLEGGREPALQGFRALVRRTPRPLALEQRFMFDGAAVGEAINVLAVNDAPVLDLVDSGQSFAEGVSGAALFSNAVLTDTDSADLDGGILRVGGLAAGDSVSIATDTANTAGAIRLAANGHHVQMADGLGGWTTIGSLDASAGSDVDITFTSELVTPAVAQSVLRALVFSNSSDAPEPSRSLEVSVSDGDGGISIEDSLQVDITEANDRPVIADPTTAFLVGLVRNNAAPADGTASGFLVSELFKTARISDPDSSSAAELGIAITGVGSSVDGVYYSTDAGGTWTQVTGVSSTNVLLLANDASTRIHIDHKPGGGSATAAQANPDGVFTFQAWDKSAGTAGSVQAASGLGNALSTASASSVNIRNTAAGGYTAPVNTLPASLSGPEGMGLTLSGFSIADSGTIGAGTTYTVRFIVSAGHINGAGSGGVTVTGGGAGNPAITLSGTLANINTYLGVSNLTYQPGADFTGPVTLTMVTTDPDGLADGDSTTITLSAVNDAPRADLNNGFAGLESAVSFVEDGGPVAIAPVAALWDVDSNTLTSLTVTLTNRPDGAAESLGLNASAQAVADAAGLTVTYTSATGVLQVSGSASAARYETVLRGITYDNTDATPSTTPRTVHVQASDGAHTSLVYTATVSVNEGNDAPVIDVYVEDKTATAGLPFAFSIEGTFVDPDGDTLEYTAALASGAALPSWLTFDAATQRFYGTPSGSGIVSVKVTATDPDGLSVVDEFDIDVGSTLGGEPVIAVSFPQVYALVDAASHSNSGYYHEETSSFTTAATPLTGSNFVFYQVGSDGFQGNNVPGFLSYVDAEGVLQTLAGLVSRPIKSSGNLIQGFYMWVDAGTEAVEDDTAYLLVVRPPDFTGGSDYNSSSDRVDEALNRYRDSNPDVSDETVNEGSDEVVFTVVGAADTDISLELVESTGAGYADIDETQVLQYYDTATGQWVDYDGTSVTLPESSLIQVRVDIRAEQDTVYEMAETFVLRVSLLGSGVSADGTGTIIDDGTGDYWIDEATEPATPAELVENDIALDDDRNPVALDNGYAAVVGTPVSGNVITDDANGVDTEGGLDYDLAGRSLTVAEVEGTAFGDLDDSTSVDHPSGEGWKQVELAEGTLYIKADGSFAYLPTSASTDGFTYRVYNGNNASLTAATVTFDITAGNTPPQFESDHYGDLTETDTTLTATGSITVSDAESASVTVQVTDLAVSTTFPGTLPSALTADDYQGLKDMFGIVVTPASVQSGYQASIDWTFTSGSSGDLAFDFLAEGETLTLVYTIEADDGELSDTTTVRVIVTGTNDTPELSGQSRTVDETNVGLVVTGSLTVVDVDITDTVSLSLADITVKQVKTSSGGTLPEHLKADGYAALKAMLTLGPPSQAIAADPAAGTEVGWRFDTNGDPFDFLRGGETLVITFTVQATDSSAEPAEPGESRSATNTLEVRINGTNDLPVASDDTAQTSQGTPLVLGVGDFGAFVDPDSSLGAVVLQSLAGPGRFQFLSSTGVWQDIGLPRTVTSTDLGQGRLRYVPGEGYGSPYATLTFKVQDLPGAQSLSSYTLTVNVTEALPQGNTRPTSINDAVSLNEDSPKVLALTDFGRYADADEDAQAGVEITQLPAKGKLQKFNGGWAELKPDPVSGVAFVSAADITAGRLRFAPEPNGWGVAYASAQFKVVDARGATSASAYSLRFDVREVSDSTPTSTNDARTVASASTTALALGDFGLYSDGVDGDTLAKVRITSLPSTGQLRVLINGGASFTPVTVGMDLTRAQITGGRLVYVAGAGPYATSVGFRVSDGTSLSPTYTLTLTVDGPVPSAALSLTSFDTREGGSGARAVGAERGLTEAWEAGVSVPATGGRSSLTEQLRKARSLPGWLGR